ncbi:RNA polymerase factor sigma-54, partial [Myxococcota bacterium]|nr:RNA polymerase factor sigma-54 [Myxococcota bacterium]
DVEECEVEAVLKDIQALEPPGVAARDLRECLLIQAREEFSEASLVYEIIENHLDELERQKLKVIARATKSTLDEVKDAIQQLTSLEPRPGRIFVDRAPQYITPDIYVKKVGEEWVIQLNDDGLPKLRVSNYYRQTLSSSKGEAKAFLKEKLQGAAWLIRSIHMRQRTMYRVTESILRFQADFFEEGVAHLKPLVLRDVAEDVEMHESTISRVTSNKYVHCPQGIFELKYFFNSGISKFGGESIASESVRDHIKRLVDSENPKSPLSDNKIVQLLKDKNIDIARRTVAKYREMLRIPSSSRRKKRF